MVTPRPIGAEASPAERCIGGRGTSTASRGTAGASTGRKGDPKSSSCTMTAQVWFERHGSHLTFFHKV